MSLISHIEIPAKDLDVSKEFFLKLFGWEFKNFGNGYLLFNDKKGITVGLKKYDEVNTGNTTIFHITVTDIDARLEKAVSLGGKIVRGKTVIPVMGYYALINDPDGNTIGLYQSH